MLASLKTAYGVVRSLRIYYGDRQHRTAMDAMYARFVKPGDLVFDIGSHVGDRVGSFRRLGASVVALEPQAPLIRVLRWIYGRDRNVTLVHAAAARSSGTVQLNLNPRQSDHRHGIARVHRCGARVRKTGTMSAGPAPSMSQASASTS